MKTLKGRGAITSLIWISALASGCAADPAGWDQAPTHKPLPAQVVPVDPDTLKVVCGPNAGACALRDYVFGLCFIYAPSDALDDLMDHERKHCRGWDHAPYQPMPIWNVDVNGTR